VSETEPQPPKPDDAIRFYFEKGNFFRVIHADGAHGGLTPDGQYITMNLYNERQPIPKHQDYIPSGERLVAVEPPYKRDGIIREVEVSVVMNLETATVLNQWLADKIQSLQHIQEVIRESKTAKTSNAEQK